jgi:uncharacterized protein Yka (UPF0111/DUF47 family)
VTPIDREDIHALTGALDDVMDTIDASAGYVRLYNVKEVRFGAREMAAIIVEMAKSIRLAIDGVGPKKLVAPHIVEINRLENEADRAHFEAVRRLFDEEKDPILLFKWKEILDRLEDATDRGEDVANVIEGIVLKNG